MTQTLPDSDLSAPDGLAVVDHRGCGGCDRLLAANLDPEAQVEAELGLAALERPHAPPHTSDEALARELGEIAADRDFGNRKYFRKFRNLNGITALEHPEHALHALVR